MSKNKAKNVLSIRMFTIEGILGYGAFSTVYQVRHNEANKQYAMKVMDKNILIKQKHLHYIITEFRILKKVNNFPFILSLHYAFQTANYLYMIIDYCSKGDITKIRFINNPKLLFAELILAFEYLHNKNIIYRDLKPENILLSEDGHIKLCDFNLAKEDVDERTRALSFCGSPMYLSPEMLGQDGVNKAADIYGIGLIIYEVLTGVPAFYTNNPQKLYENILTNNINFNHEKLKPIEKDLLKKILIKDISSRYTLEQIKRHPYFKEVNWNDVLNLKCGKIFIEKWEKKDLDKKKIPERAHNITKKEIKKDSKREMKNCVRNYFFMKENPSQKK